MLDRRLAEAALRHRDRAPERLVVGGIRDELEVRHEIADLAPVVEAHRADEAIRHRVPAQRFFERAALRVRAIEDRDVVAASATPTARDARSISLDDEVGLVALVERSARRVTRSPARCVARSVLPMRSCSR